MGFEIVVGLEVFSSALAVSVLLVVVVTPEEVVVLLVVLVFVGMVVAVPSLEVVKTCVGDVDGLFVGAGSTISVEVWVPVDVRVPVFFSVTSIEGLAVGS